MSAVERNVWREMCGERCGEREMWGEREREMWREMCVYAMNAATAATKKLDRKAKSLLPSNVLLAATLICILS